MRYRAIDGEGARLYGGRWNSEGVAVAYAAVALSLAALEYLVHLEVEDAPADLVAVGIEVPDDIASRSMHIVELPGLPEGWRETPAPPECQALGDAWAAARETMLLRVPSALIPEAHNVLLNPLHPDVQHVRVAEERPFSFDPRLLARGASSSGSRRRR